MCFFSLRPSLFLRLDPRQGLCVNGENCNGTLLLLDIYTHASIKYKICADFIGCIDAVTLCKNNAEGYQEKLLTKATRKSHLNSSKIQVDFFRVIFFNSYMLRKNTGFSLILNFLLSQCWIKWVNTEYFKGWFGVIWVIAGIFKVEKPEFFKIILHEIKTLYMESS